SHFFDGYKPFFTNTDELFETMCRIADTLGTRDFFVLDENFLDQRERVERLAQLMEERQRFFHLDIFSSLRTVTAYDPLFLIRLGVQFVWIGIESKHELYDKVKGIDASSVIRRLRDHGISVLVSTMLFLEHHDEHGLREDVDYAIGLEPDFLQFMEYSALPGTELYQRMKAENRLLTHIPYQEWHGQDRIWFKHPHFSPDQTKQRLDWAFARDFEILGPSLLRIADTRIRPVMMRPPSHDVYLARRILELRDAAREMYPLLPSLVRMAPNAFVRHRAERVAALYDQRLGPMSLAEKVAAGLISLFARMEERRVRLGETTHQPPTFRETYRQR
ncbi:MAG TPA: radical SAM protein, partial [Candidatus Ozemobacteraceae bacterium]|nr:radical SAM protein [Candidatus Ozemobacteraceae bacterium]